MAQTEGIMIISINNMHANVLVNRVQQRVTSCHLAQSLSTKSWVVHECRVWSKTHYTCGGFTNWYSFRTVLILRHRKCSIKSPFACEPFVKLYATDAQNTSLFCSNPIWSIQLIARLLTLCKLRLAVQWHSNLILWASELAVGNTNYVTQQVLSEIDVKWLWLYFLLLINTFF